MRLKKTYEENSNVKHSLLSLLTWIIIQYNILKLNFKVMWINKTIKQIHNDNGVEMVNFTEHRLLNIKNDIITALEGDKYGYYLVTLPDIAIRDFIYSDPLFKNFYSDRVSFREKKNKKNRLWLYSIERL